MEMKPITQKEVLKNRFIRIYKNEYGQKNGRKKKTDMGRSQEDENKNSMYIHWGLRFKAKTS